MAFLLKPDTRASWEVRQGKRLSHWFTPDKSCWMTLPAKGRRHGTVPLEPSNEWIRCGKSLKDLKHFGSTLKAGALWRDITRLPLGLDSLDTRSQTPETRQKHIEVALDKLNKGMRRPCCFNRNL